MESILVDVAVFMVGFLFCYLMSYCLMDLVSKWSHYEAQRRRAFDLWLLDLPASQYPVISVTSYADCEQLPDVGSDDLLVKLGLSGDNDLVANTAFTNEGMFVESKEEISCMSSSR